MNLGHFVGAFVGSITAFPIFANACMETDWKSSSAGALKIVKEMNIDFEANPAVETWQLYVTTFNRKIKNVDSQIPPSCKIILTGIQGHIASSLEEMPATERWQDAAILFESYISTVDQVYDNLSR